MPSPTTRTFAHDRPEEEVLWQGGWWPGELCARRLREGVWDGFVRFSERPGEYAATRYGWFVYDTELRRHGVNAN